jgi:CBS domain-containing protein
VYRWNRPCYGVGGGKPHVRIENRYIPSGPTVADEMANFVFWVGLMRGRPAQFDNLPEVMDFRDAKSNFIKAARYGQECMLYWDGEYWSPKRLTTDVLLPIARAGLEKDGIAQSDIDHYLGIIEKRASASSGSQWMIRNYRRFRKKVQKDDALLALTKAIHDNSLNNTPVHEWPAQLPDDELHQAATNVEHIMQTNLFSVNENDLAELAVDIMSWMDIHHVPVENSRGDLCGILTWTHMQRFNEKGIASENLPVRDIMTTSVLSVQPKTQIQEAIRVMKKHEIGCLPVIEHQKLVGIITVKDVLPFHHDGD